MANNDLKIGKVATVSGEDAEAETRRLRIATWNMDHWKRNVQQRQDGWTKLRDREIADVALLQECVPPSDIHKTHHAYREIGGSRSWGSAVVSFDPSIEVDEIGTVRSRYSPTKFSMLGTYPGSIIVTRLNLADVGSITCVSVYGLINVYSQTTMLRIVADLIPLFDSPDGQRVILGGDLNVTTANNPQHPEFPRYKAILQAVESLGLENVALTAEKKAPSIENCLCGQADCFHLKTYGNFPGTQFDWLYATPELARRCRMIEVLRDSPFDELSDHSPVVAEFDVPIGVPNRMWEPESIVEEMGIRHGEKVQKVLDELIAWVYTKHGKLSRTYKSVSLNRLPTSTGDEPIIWVQLDLKYPDRIQYTFSVNSRGELVIQFQYMIAPYDTDDAKEKMWAKINKIPNIEIPKKLDGRPSFPLASLAAPAAFEQFIAIFDEFIDHTIEQHVHHQNDD